jgi:hypothetical protein
MLAKPSNTLVGPIRHGSLWSAMSELIVAMEAYAENFQLPCFATAAAAQDAKSTPECGRRKDPRVSTSRRFDACSPLVAVEVGNGDAMARFMVHRPVLSRSSEFLKARLKPSWCQNASDGECIKLPEHDPAVFDLYVNWLYSDTLPISRPQAVAIDKHGASKDDVNGKEAQENDWLLLAEAYVLGEALVDPAFQSPILDAMALMIEDDDERKALWRVLSEVVETVYEGTAESSPARNWLVQIVRRYRLMGGAAEGFDEHSLPEDFWRDMQK